MKTLLLLFLDANTWCGKNATGEVLSLNLIFSPYVFSKEGTTEKVFDADELLSELYAVLKSVAELSMWRPCPCCRSVLYRGVRPLRVE